MAKVREWLKRNEKIVESPPDSPSYDYPMEDREDIGENKYWKLPSNQEDTVSENEVENTENDVESNEIDEHNNENRAYNNDDDDDYDDIQITKYYPPGYQPDFEETE